MLEQLIQQNKDNVYFVLATIMYFYMLVAFIFALIGKTDKLTKATEDYIDSTIDNIKDTKI